MSRPTHAWCPTCKEESAIDSTGRCLWCEGATQPSKPKRRRAGGKPAGKWGKLTDSQLRALHAAHMKGRSINSLAKEIYERVGYASHGSCATSISKGWKRLDLHARDRIEMTVIASTKHGRKRRELTPAEEQAYRRWLRDQRGWRSLQGPGRPRCAGVRKQYPRKGEPCQRPAMEGSDYCSSHDPQRRAERDEHLRQMREAATA